MVLVGVDIGGTKICICLGDRKGTIYSSERIETRSLKGADLALPLLFDKIDTILEKAGLTPRDIKAVGLSVPGPISFEKGMILKPPNLPGWVNVPIQKRFKEHFKCPTFLNNDANAGALAEWEFGGSENLTTLVYLTMSTGMGGGIIANGELLQGKTDTAGEIGHFILDPKGPKCPCGQRGCFEAFCGGASLAYEIQKEIRQRGIQTEILNGAKGRVEAIDMKCLAEAVKKNDPYALEVWEGFIERLAQGIGILLMVLNPDLIILGTIASHLQGLLTIPLKKSLEKYAWSIPFEHCRIEESRLGARMSPLSSLAVALKGLREIETENL